MREITDQSSSARSRRDLLVGLTIGATGLVLGPSLARSQGAAEPDEAAVLRDPDVPVAGNADGDIAVVEWFDYNCPYCRKLEPELQQVVHADGKVRWVLKDWPILGPVSVVAARMVLASKYQDKYFQAHDALISVNSKLTEPRIDELLVGAGVDVDRAKRDLTANATAIDGLLARNKSQADGLGFRGTPAFIVGKFRVPGTLTAAQFEQVIADARKAKAAL